MIRKVDRVASIERLKNGFIRLQLTNWTQRILGSDRLSQDAVVWATVSTLNHPVEGSLPELELA